MGRLAVYDVMGIQRFVFGTNRLKENIGGSILVEKVLSLFLPQTIKAHTQKCYTNWSKAERFEMLHDPYLEAEVIYIGGGNALVAYRDKDIEMKVTRAFSKLVFEKTYSLGVASASIETDFTSNFDSERLKLFNELSKKKAEYIKTYPLMGIAITKQDIETGFPITSFNQQGEYFTMEKYLKQKEEGEAFSRFVNGNRGNEYSFLGEEFLYPREIDDLGQYEGENFIAIVHIDGNNMGRKISNCLQGYKNYEEAVQKMRCLSLKISETYSNAFKNLVELIQENINGLEKRKIIKAAKAENGKRYLPIRPIILNGDDITFICHAKIALHLSEIFLNYIKKQFISDLKSNLSACAGIAIFKSHFPFSKAYELAEECCTSAKAKAKFPFYTDGEKIGNWIDFHVCYGGITENLSKFRERCYNVADLKAPIDRSSDRVLKGYNLLWRPWCMDDSPETEQYSWEYFKKMNQYFLKDKETKWPRSKLKGLRDAYSHGAEAVRVFLEEANSRGYFLPEINGQAYERGFNADGCTPYFDVLEMMDLYEELGEGEM